MHFHDDALFPEIQDPLVITAAPYGPEWEPADFREDLPLTMDEHVQAAVDCWNAGATVLHIHVRELDGKGSKRMSQFNELLGRLREAVPEMILQVGGSISFAPEGDGADAKWLEDDARHMLADLDPKPDQVTIAINTSQMNIVELMTDDDIAGTSFERPEVYEAYREMHVPANPSWVKEHLKRLTANGIQPHFQLANIPQLETVERLIRKGHYMGPLNLTWVEAVCDQTIANRPTSQGECDICGEEKANVQGATPAGGERRDDRTIGRPGEGPGPASRSTSVDHGENLLCSAKIEARCL